MKTKNTQTLAPIKPFLNTGEEVLYHRRVFNFLNTDEIWCLTNHRLIYFNKKVFEEKTLFEPEELVVFHETGKVQFSGNVHLLTTQRLLVLDIGAKEYLLQAILLSKINQVDICVVANQGQNAITYGIRIDVNDREDPAMIIHGGVNTNGIDQYSLNQQEQKNINERFPRKVCEVTGLKFALPQMRSGPGGYTPVTFYSKSDLVWPASCSSCNKEMQDLVYDKFTVVNPWLSTYGIGLGLLPWITYSIPYCPACYKGYFGLEMVSRAVEIGWAQFDGARVELLFRNRDYAVNFITANSQ
jgi:hypothetical protein